MGLLVFVINIDDIDFCVINWVIICIDVFFVMVIIFLCSNDLIFVVVKLLLLVCFIMV